MYNYKGYGRTPEERQFYIIMCAIKKMEKPRAKAPNQIQTLRALHNADQPGNVKRLSQTISKNAMQSTLRRRLCDGDYNLGNKKLEKA